MSGVTLKYLKKTYNPGTKDNFYAVKGIDLEIRDKEFMVLVGPSGCGKSTTLRMIAGLEEASSGDIFIGDRRVNDVLPKNRGVAMVFQNYALYPHMTVADNMAFGLKLRKTPKAEIQQRVEEAADTLGLSSMLNRKPKALSGGQRQRVALGRAIVRKPDVFLFDEPLSNLDAKMRVQMRAEISKLHARLNATMIYVTHDQTEAMTMGDRICVMKDGEIMQVDEPINIYQSPANMFTAGFIGLPQMNFLHGSVVLGDGGYHFMGQATGLDRIELSARLGEIARGYLGKPLVLGVRPEHFSACEADDPQAIHAKVEVGEPLGAESFIHLSVANGGKLVVRLVGIVQSNIGQSLSVKPNLDEVHLFDPESGLRLKAPRVVA
ncbi:MAG: sn-glycerol-3-phosphate ABC transporter ATP-binding protein UgpC [Verrucomicrobiota bacterium]|nr:sn-glycerol-3-phosphate ABC transporter ATP-binding protein UgpC [Verrucomicrobiota bacterium]